MTVEVAQRPASAARVVKRYINAFRVAAVGILVDGMVRAIGAIAGLILVAGGYFAAANFLPRGPEGLTRHALLVWVIFFILGTIMRSQGQLLRASSDGAVHSSRFLNDEQKARAMQL